MCSRVHPPLVSVVPLSLLRVSVVRVLGSSISAGAIRHFASGVPFDGDSQVGTSRIQLTTPRTEPGISLSGDHRSLIRNRSSVTDHPSRAAERREVAAEGADTSVRGSKGAAQGGGLARRGTTSVGLPIYMSKLNKSSPRPVKRSVTLINVLFYHNVITFQAPNWTHTFRFYARFKARYQP